ncbi:ligand-dependent nuclear receptor-interacting factor 1 [Lepisosteus oculatus]|uniref:ligand-dependent nuclear receptor-interacting factor 1 n=1 Tax=Lepisosteus oculatus TaxID=7918 RepID=UPI003720B561
MIMNNNFVRFSVPLKPSDNLPASSNQSVSHGYYQVMPTICSNGQNILKLIPVQKVGGQFLQMQAKINLSSTYKNSDAEALVTTNQPAIRFTPTTVSPGPIAILQQTSPGKFILKRQSDGNVLVNPIHGMGQLQEKVTFATTCSPVHIQVPVTPHKPQQTSAPVEVLALNSTKTPSVLNLKQLPVTVKSPVLPNGHCLQIPANAEVKSFPASALPQAIKKKILPPTINCSVEASDPSKNAQTVIYVSPVNTIKTMSPVQTIPVSSATEALTHLLKVAKHSVGNDPVTTTAKSALPKSSQNTASPIKWVVQENPDAPAPCLVPVTTKDITTDILKTLTRIEKQGKDEQNVASKSTVSQDIQPKVTAGKDNALVMCNGKLYFVAKKTSEFSNISSQSQKVSENIGKDSSVASHQNPPSSQNLPAASSRLRTSDLHCQHMEPILINDGPDDIVDLCNEGSQDEPTHQKNVESNKVQSPVNQSSRNDDDDDSNVIFVSYIPPKTAVESNKDRESVPRTSPSACSRPEKSTVDSGQQQSIGNFSGKRKCESDSQLRKQFGITSEIKICLQRAPLHDKLVRDKSQRSPSTSKCTLEGIRKLIQGSRMEMKTKKHVEVVVVPDLDATPKRELESSPCDETKKRKLELPENISGTASTSGANAIAPSEEKFASSTSTSSGVQRLEKKEVQLGKESNTLRSSERSILNVTSSDSEVISSGMACAVTKCDTFSPMKAILPAMANSAMDEIKETEELGPALSNSVAEVAGVQNAVKCNKPQESYTNSSVRKEIHAPSKTDPVMEKGMPNLSLSSAIRTESNRIEALVNISLEAAAAKKNVAKSCESSDCSVPMEICSLSTSFETSVEHCTSDDLYTVTPMDAEEIVRDEKIKRLRELLKQKEAALEVLRKDIIKQP